MVDDSSLGFAAVDPTGFSDTPCGTIILTNAGFSLGTLAVDQTCTGNGLQGRCVSAQRSSGRRGSDGASKRLPPAEASASAEQDAKPPTTTTSPDAACSSSGGSFTAASKRRRHRLDVDEETQEQLVAVARGGVRYAGKVFHRRGVKLTQDSPRSMIPRDVRWPLAVDFLRIKNVRSLTNWILGSC